MFYNQIIILIVSDKNMISRSGVKVNFAIQSNIITLLL